MGKKVFISHIAEETKLAKLIKRYLDDHFLGLLEVFTYSDSMSNPAGQKWFDTVDSALKAADVELLLCSDASISRPWINFEAGAGCIREIPVIPVCHTGMHPNELPVPLNSLRAIEANQEEGIKDLYAVIASSVGCNAPSRNLNEMLEEIRAFEKLYAAQRAEKALVSRQLNDIVLRLDALTLGIAELELREKITVIKHRAKKFRLKPREHLEDEVILLMGDSTAGLPLFEYAPEQTRCEYVEAVFEAVSALGEEYVLDGASFQRLLVTNLAKHVANIPNTSKAEIREQLSSLIERCTAQFSVKNNDSKL